MNICLLGRKLGMLQVYDEAGRPVAATALTVGPCWITQIRTPDRDGYAAVQIGYDSADTKRLTRPAAGHLKKAQAPSLRLLREFRVSPGEVSQYQVSQQITVEALKDARLVDIVGTSIGKGFQGGMKRHGFRGGPATHGSMSHRAPGSIGGRMPARVLKGQRMAGRMGGARTTVKNLAVLRVLPDRNILIVRGAVPGPAGSYVMVRRALKSGDAQ